MSRNIPRSKVKAEEPRMPWALHTDIGCVHFLPESVADAAKERVTLGLTGLGSAQPRTGRSGDAVRHVAGSTRRVSPPSVCWPAHAPLLLSTRTHPSSRPHTHAYLHTHTHTRTHMYLHTCLFPCPHAHTYSHTPLFPSTHTHVLAYAYSHTRTHVRKHAPSSTHSVLRPAPAPHPSLHTHTHVHT